MEIKRLFLQYWAALGRVLLVVTDPSLYLSRSLSLSLTHSGISRKRMLLSYRPLVSVSVVTLLGWCWYSFRRRRTTAHLDTEEEVCFLDEKSLVSCSPAGSERLVYTKENAA